MKDGDTARRKRSYIHDRIDCMIKDSFYTTIHKSKTSDRQKDTNPMLILHMHNTLSLIKNGWLEFSDGLGHNVTASQVLIENAKDLVVQCLVHTDTFNHLLDRLK